MRQLFLTSSAHKVAFDIPRHVDLSKGNRLLFIDTAAEPEKDDDIEWLQNDRAALVSAGFHVEDYTITGKTSTQLIRDLHPIDYIYCSGGDTAYLLEQSYRSGFSEVIRTLIEKEGKIYIGTSAGSIITGPKLPAYFTDDGAESVVGKPAFNFVNFTIVPHWGSDYFKDLYLSGRLEKVCSEHEVPFILLTDYQYIHVMDDHYRIIDVLRTQR